jgi:phosphate transport system substrate-binding protein
VADGVIDLGVSGRPLDAAESARGLTIVAEFRTPFGLATSHPKPDGFNSSEIARLYQSDRPRWSDGQPITIFLRPTNESDTQVLASLFPGMKAAIARARDRPDLSVAATDQDNADLAEKTQGSLVGATFTQIIMEKRDLRFVAIDGIEPSLASYQQGTYPFGKTLYVVAGSQKAAAVAHFLRILRSPEGVAVLRQAGILLSSQ